MNKKNEEYNIDNEFEWPENLRGYFKMLFTDEFIFTTIFIYVLFLVIVSTIIHQVY